MDVAEAEDKAANALDEALDWPYSREVWDRLDTERVELLAANDALAAELAEERLLRRLDCEMSEACCQCSELRAELARCNASLETAVGANAMWKRLHDEAQAELARCRALLTTAMEWIGVDPLPRHEQAVFDLRQRIDAALAGAAEPQTGAP
jgi:hypothetical protein